MQYFFFTNWWNLWGGFPETDLQNLLIFFSYGRWLNFANFFRADRRISLIFPVNSWWISRFPPTITGEIWGGWGFMRSIDELSNFFSLNAWNIIELFSLTNWWISRFFFTWPIDKFEMLPPWPNGEIYIFLRQHNGTMDIFLESQRRGFFFFIEWTLISFFWHQILEIISFF